MRLSGASFFYICLNTYFNLSFLKLACDSCFALCTINLVPALPLDGGRMLKSMLTSRYGILKAYNFTRRISLFFIILLAVSGIVLFIASNFNFSLILISAFLFQSLTFEQNNMLITNLKELLSTKQKPGTDSMLRTKSICFKENQSASRFLKFLSYDCFYIIHVLDKNFEISKTLSEIQVVDAITNHGIRVKFADIKS